MYIGFSAAGPKTLPERCMQQELNTAINNLMFCIILKEGLLQRTHHERRNVLIDEVYLFDSERNKHAYGSLHQC